MKQIFMQKNALGPADVRAEQVPVPRCGPSHVLIATRYSLISAGTETSAVRRNKRDMVVKALRDPDIRQSVIDMVVGDGISKTLDRVGYEMTKWTPLGYSGAGIAVEVGSDVDFIRPGDLVAYGGEGHAEYVRVSKQLCVRVPDEVSTQEASFVALGSIALQAVRRAQVQVGDVVAVLGLGLVGQLVSQMLQAAGARVLGADVLPERLKLAQQLGLERGFMASDQLPSEIQTATHGIGVDGVVICASGGGNAVIEQAVAMARDRGRITVVGLVELDVPTEEFYRKELDLVISRSYGPGRYDAQYEQQGIDYPIGYVRWTEQRNMQEFLRLVQAGKVQLKPLITHEFPLDDAAAAYDTLMDKHQQCLALLLKYDTSSAVPTRITTGSRQPRPIKPTSANVAVIGCGAFARQVHLPNLKRCPDLSLGLLVASSSQNAREMAVRYAATKSATDVDAVWDDPSLDAVLILTRDNSHAALSIAALQGGKHVFCEKPLATTLDDCQALAAVASQSDRACLVGFNRRFAPLAQALKAELDRSPEPKLMHYRVSAGPLPRDHWVYDPAHAAGRIVGEACHFIDLMCWLAGSDPIKVTAHAPGACPSVNHLEDVTATFEFADGSVGTLLYASQGAKNFPKERLEVFAPGVTAALDDFRELTIRGPRRIDERHRRPDKGHAAELQHFADAIRGHAPPLLDYRDGLRATLCCLRLIESARTREPLTIDLSDF